MKIAVEFTYHTDIISVPEEIGRKIKQYQKMFDKWLYNKANNHGNWVIINNRKVAVSFDTKSFVDYINSVHLSNCKEKAYIVEDSAQNVPSGIPTLFF